jgi:hypothetical protein
MDQIPTLTEATLRIVDNFWAKDFGSTTSGFISESESCKFVVSNAGE